MIKRGPKRKTDRTPGAKIFYVDNYDPRMPHPRLLITRNYHHIANHPVVSKLFPRENLVASCRRLPNLGEILSPTVQSSTPPDRNVGEGIGSGSYYCENYRRGKSCDVCKHMQRETSFVESVHFNGRKSAIHGHLVHLPASQRPKLRWFVYLLEDRLCMLQYVGSTTDVCSRWSSTKSACNKGDSNSTGMYKHFMEGCPNDTGVEKEHLRLTLLDYFDTTEERLRTAGHQPGPQCQCSECAKLLKTENKWILRLGTFFAPAGLNTRNEIKSTVRGNYRRQGH